MVMVVMMVMMMMVRMMMPMVVIVLLAIVAMVVVVIVIVIVVVVVVVVVVVIVIMIMGAFALVRLIIVGMSKRILLIRFFCQLVILALLILFLIILVPVCAVMRMHDFSPSSKVEQLMETRPTCCQVAHARSVIVSLPAVQQRQVIEAHTIAIPSPGWVPQMPLLGMLKSRVRGAP